MNWNRACAVFDMDGTLIDSMGYWNRLGREYLASYGITENVDGALARTVTMTMLESGALFAEAFGIPGPAARVADEMNAIMEAHYRTDIPLKPGVADYLGRLRAAGVRLALATSSPEALARVCLGRLGVADCFEFLLSCDAVAAGKDRPDVFFEAARRLNAAPAEIAVYEDALFSARTAKDAGFFVVGVYDDAGAAEWPELRALCDAAVTDWRKLLCASSKTNVSLRN